METETHKMTAIEAVNITKNLLGDISIPTKYKDAIGSIHAAMNNLAVIAQMIDRELKEAEHAHDQDNEGDI